MAGILSLQLRISTKNAISIIRRNSVRNIKTIAKPVNISLSSCRYTAFSCTRNNVNVASLFNVRPRYFKISTVLYEEIDVNVPIFPEAISQGDVKWRKKVGDSVVTDEVVCDIETDKTVIEVHSPANGVIVATYADEGAAVVSKQKVFRIKVGAVTEKAKDIKPPDKPVSKTVPLPQPAEKPKPIPAPKSTPEPPIVKPVPPIVQPEMKHHELPPSKTSVVKLPPKDPTKEIKGTRSEHRVKMSRIRQIISQRLKQAQNENAMLTTFNEIDMTNLIAFRKTHQEAFLKKHGVKLGFMSTFVKASAYALQDQPIINAHIMDNEIIYRDYVDISVAVATPKGLVVPVIRNVDEMNFADIEKNIVMLSEKAKKGKLTIEDMNGGTFTISNGGVFGSLMGTPIINPPQSAILGMHATFDRPVAVEGKIVIKPMMYVALTYDHRLIDGREAVLFLRKIKSGVENPVIIVAGL